MPEVHQSVTQDGLLGLALHPQLLTGSDAVFVAYTYDDAPGPTHGGAALPTTRPAAAWRRRLTC
jgi:hypothetical protein